MVFLGQLSMSSPFQPTLPVRGATTMPPITLRIVHFNPRSPCGERRDTPYAY